MNTYDQAQRAGEPAPAPMTIALPGGEISSSQDKIALIGGEIFPNQSKIALIGGDRRMLSLARLLMQEKYAVRLFACPKAPENTDFCHAPSLEKALEGADAVILPIPACREGEWLNAPCRDAGFADGKLSLTETLLPALTACAPKAQILCGMPSDSLRKAAKSAGIPLYDYGADEAFVQENAILTAEGLLPLLEQHLASPVDASAGPALVAGCGRVGKAVADALAACGVKVTILCRSAAAMEEAAGKGFGTLSFQELRDPKGAECLAGAAMLLNTVPAPVFDAVTLRPFRGLYVELASGKGGLAEDAEPLRSLPSFLALPGIPGKVLPEKAGLAIGRAVLRRLTHLQGKEVSDPC